MDEKLLNKLAEVLKRHGIADEEIEKVKLELNDEPKEDETENEQVEEETLAPSNDSSVAEGEDKKVEETEESKPVESEEPMEEQPQVEDSPVEEPETEEETPGLLDEEPQENVGEELPNGATEVNPEELGNEPQEPTEPQVDVQSLLGQLEEERKAREGLLARIDALESALKESGIMSESHSLVSPVGVDDGTRVKDHYDDDANFESILREINKPQY